MGFASLGLGTVFVCASTTALTGVAHEESGAASGFLNTWHEFGEAIGVAALGAVVAVPAGMPLPGFIAVAVAALVVAAVAVAIVPPGRPEGGAVGFSH